MLKVSRVFLALAVLVAAVVVAAPQTSASAATITTQTVVLTEAQINSSYWVTNPIRRAVTNTKVTLGDGKVTISATLTPANRQSFDAQTIWKPFIAQGGTLVFNFQSATLNGNPANAQHRRELQLAHQTIARDAIRDYVRTQVKGSFKYKSIAVTPGQVAVTVEVASK